jgi:hypothetical protein
VDLPAAVLAQLQDLAASIGQDDHDLSDSLAGLIAALRSTAASYCGFQLTLCQNQWPVTLAAFTGGSDIPIRTSLRLPLALVSRRFVPESRAIFFAGTPGAFTDLATDLSHALGDVHVEQTPATDRREASTHVDGQRPAIELDADVPPLSRESGLTGRAELAVLNRAIGMLVARGHDIEHAHQLLRRDAAAAGVEPHVYAARILRR